MSGLLRKSLIFRILARARRDGLAPLQYAYLYGYALPLLRLSGVISGPLHISRGYGSFLLLSGDAFLKLAVSGRATIREEYGHYLRLNSAQPLLAAQLPGYHLVEYWLLSCLKCEHLTKVEPADALPLAVDIQRKFDAAGVEQRRLGLNDCPQIQAGLRYMEDEFGGETAHSMRRLASEYLVVGNYAVGLAHGDFHSRNIMRDATGNCRIIDLDCFRFQGVREFDALYFALEHEWSASGRLWTETLGDCLTGAGGNVRECLMAFGVAWSNGLGFTFFLDRLGQDAMNYGIRYSRASLQTVVEAARTIVKESA